MLDVFAIQSFSRTIGILPLAVFALPRFGALGVADGVDTGAHFLLQFRSVALEPCGGEITVIIASAVVRLRAGNQSKPTVLISFNTASVVTRAPDRKHRDLFP